MFPRISAQRISLLLSLFTAISFGGTAQGWAKEKKRDQNRRDKDKKERTQSVKLAKVPPNRKGRFKGKKSQNVPTQKGVKGTETADCKKKRRPDLSIGGLPLYPYRRGWPCKREIRSQRELKQRLLKILKSPKLRNAKVGMIVLTSDGESIFKYHAEELLIPASNVKLFTTAAALHYLGPHYRFTTKIYADSPIDSEGKIEGNLYIVGSGDPSLRSEELWRITRDLHLLGLREVTGRLIFDASFFDRNYFGPGWEEHANQPGERFRPYLALISALSLNYNTITIAVRPGKKIGEPAIIELDPRSPYVKKVKNSTITVEANGKFRVKIKMKSWRNYREIIEVKGTVPLMAEPRFYWRRITHPEWYTAFQMARFLRIQGIKIQSWPKRGTLPEKAALIYEHHSQPLAVLLRYANKFSSNFTSEQITKTIGAEVFKPPGTWKKGVRAIVKFLKKIGIKAEETHLINGSGLSRENRITPRAMAKLLLFMLKNFAVRPEFIAYQPIAGFDGTLKKRMVNSSASGVLRAKTGSLDGVSSLSGYVETPNHKLLVFSILMNGKKYQGKIFRKLQDKIGQTLALFNPKN